MIRLSNRIHSSLKCYCQLFPVTHVLCVCVGKCPLALVTAECSSAAFNRAGLMPRIKLHYHLNNGLTQRTWGVVNINKLNVSHWKSANKAPPHPDKTTRKKIFTNEDNWEAKEDDSSSLSVLMDALGLKEVCYFRLETQDRSLPLAELDY